ncbi:MAG: hypothetical protein MK212_09860 [Saprospiraceae bacterium]|nr:hypothetical protein [Saprospiraceae bacterium]
MKYTLSILCMLLIISTTCAQRYKGQLKDKKQDTTRPLVTEGDYYIVHHHSPGDGKIILKGKVLNRTGRPILHKKVSIKVYDGDQLIAKGKTDPKNGIFKINLGKPKIRYALKAEFRYVGMGKVPAKHVHTEDNLGYVVAPVEAVYMTEALPHEEVTFNVRLGIWNVL